MQAEDSGEEDFEREIEPDDDDSDFDEFFVDDTSSDGDTDQEVNSSGDESDWNSEDEDEIIVEKNQKREGTARIVRHPFLPAHKAAFETHTVHCNFRKMDSIIPNFIGGAIPRADKGDREYYCMAIMTLFKPTSRFKG